MNPYDLCIANKMINCKQCTLVWHVDNMKILHMDPAVVTDIINKLQAKYGKIGELTNTRGKVHDYLRMILDFQMFKYLKKVLDKAEN